MLSGGGKGGSEGRGGEGREGGSFCLGHKLSEKVNIISLPTTVSLTVQLSSPTPLETVHLYSPVSPSSKLLITSCTKSGVLFVLKRPPSLSFLLSLDQEPVGIGLPEISHFNVTLSPTLVLSALAAFVILAGAVREILDYITLLVKQKLCSLQFVDEV